MEREAELSGKVEGIRAHFRNVPVSLTVTFALLHKTEFGDATVCLLGEGHVDIPFEVCIILLYPSVLYFLDSYPRNFESFSKFLGSL